jgi:hypothetical protein
MATSVKKCQAEKGSDRATPVVGAQPTDLGVKISIYSNHTDGGVSKRKLRRFTCYWQAPGRDDGPSGSGGWLRRLLPKIVEIRSHRNEIRGHIIRSLDALDSTRL